MIWQIVDPYSTETGITIMHTKRFVVYLVIMLVLLAGCGAPSVPTAMQPSPTAPTSTSAAPTLAPTAAATVERTVPQPADPSEAVRIQFQPNTTSWYAQGDLVPDSVNRFVLSAMKGQQLNIWLTTEPASTDSPLAYLHLSDENGQSLLVSPEMYFSAVLATSQDYSIEVRSAANHLVNYNLRVEIPTAVIDPVLGGMYDLVDVAICQNIQQMATQTLGVDYTLQARAPFLDEIAGEAGQGCRLTAQGDGNKFSDASSVVQALAGSVGLGWSEQPAYQADGPTGSATALTRDMGLMMIKVNWSPDMGVDCPADQPITNCNLTPEQEIYSIQIDVAQYRADFSLDGHWEDAATGFSLDLYQDWKNIWGQHTVVAQGGEKIDSLEASINGSLKGKVAIVQFKSSFTSETGTAQIDYVDVKTITWKIITPPGGEYYLPNEATLTRK